MNVPKSNNITRDSLQKDWLDFLLSTSQVTVSKLWERFSMSVSWDIFLALEAWMTGKISSAFEMIFLNFDCHVCPKLSSGLCHPGVNYMTCSDFQSAAINYASSKFALQSKCRVVSLIYFPVEVVYVVSVFHIWRHGCAKLIFYVNCVFFFQVFSSELLSQFLNFNVIWHHSKRWINDTQSLVFGHYECLSSILKIVRFEAFCTTYSRYSSLHMQSFFVIFPPDNIDSGALFSCFDQMLSESSSNMFPLTLQLMFTCQLMFTYWKEQDVYKE